MKLISTPGLGLPNNIRYTCTAECIEQGTYTLLLPHLRKEIKHGWYFLKLEKYFTMVLFLDVSFTSFTGQAKEV